MIILSNSIEVYKDYFNEVLYCTGESSSDVNTTSESCSVSEDEHGTLETFVSVSVDTQTETIVFYADNSSKKLQIWNTEDTINNSIIEATDASYDPSSDVNDNYTVKDPETDRKFIVY